MPELTETAVREALEVGGTREAAATILGTSVRTLARAIAKLGVHRDALNANNGASGRLIEYLNRGLGYDVGEAAVYVYGTDGRAERQRIRSLLKVLENR